MKVAVVDDDNNILAHIQSLIEGASYAEDILVSVFDSAEKFFGAKHERFDIVFLDIEIGDTLGTDIALNLRANNSKSLIFFVTSHTRYISDAFRAVPFQYIIKPINEKLFVEEFERAISTIRMNKNRVIIKSSDGKEDVEIREITHIESLNRRIEVHVNGQTHQTFGAIKEYEKKLFDYGIIRCHASYLVNLRAIKSIKNYSIITKLDDVVPVSKKYLAQVRERFGNFLAGKSI